MTSSPSHCAGLSGSSPTSCGWCTEDRAQDWIVSLLTLNWPQETILATEGTFNVGLHPNGTLNSQSWPQTNL